MPMTWGDLKAQARRSILKDVNSDHIRLKWADDELADFAAWSLDEFCAHTARFVEAEYTNETLSGPASTYDLSRDTRYALPEPPYSEAMSVYIGDGSQLLPLPRRSVLDGDGFVLGPDGSLRLHAPPGRYGHLMVVYYYAYWTHPTHDEDVMTIPSWAVPAIIYKMGAHALAGIGLKSATIRQWDESGNRELNPLREQQKWFNEMYDRILSTHTPQDRTLEPR